MGSQQQKGSGLDYRKNQTKRKTAFPNLPDFQVREIGPGVVPSALNQNSQPKPERQMKKYGEFMTEI